MPLLPLEIPPGIYANGTDYQASGRWREGSLVRWVEGRLAPVGGWVATDADFEARARSLAQHQRSAVPNRSLVCGGPTGVQNYYFTTGPVYTNVSDLSSSDGRWTLDSFGDDVLYKPTGRGQIYAFDFSGPVDDTTLGSDDCDTFVVTAERFVVALAASRGNRIQWSDREDYTTWTPAATNEAGDLTLQSTGSIIGAVPVRGQTLIITTTDAHALTYVGPPFVYGAEKVGDGCGLITRQAAVPVSGGAFWMGRENFFAYQSGQAAPIPCDVHDYIFGMKDDDADDKIWAFHNSDFNEVWWFFQAEGETEISNYVAFDYRQNVWSTGELTRLCGAVSGLDAPRMVDETGQTYRHERGFDYGGATPYVETGPISLGTGDRLMSAVSLIPDEQTQGDVTATFKTRQYPNGPETSHGPYSLDDPTDVRFTGRQVRMRITGNNATDWRVGINRLDVRQRGKR